MGKRMKWDTGGASTPAPTADDLRRKAADAAAKIVAQIKEDKALTEEVTINDLPIALRDHLTRRAALASVEQQTGTCVTVKGRYYPPGVPRDISRPALHLSITAAQHLGLDQQAKVHAVRRAAAHILAITRGEATLTSPVANFPGAGTVAARPHMLHQSGSVPMLPQQFQHASAPVHMHAGSPASIPVPPSIAGMQHPQAGVRGGVVQQRAIATPPMQVGQSAQPGWVNTVATGLPPPPASQQHLPPQNAVFHHQGTMQMVQPGQMLLRQWQTAHSAQLHPGLHMQHVRQAVGTVAPSTSAASPGLAGPQPGALVAPAVQTPSTLSGRLQIVNVASDAPAVPRSSQGSLKPLPGPSNAPAAPGSMGDADRSIVPVPFSVPPGCPIADLICGPNGSYISHIERETGAVIRLQGHTPSSGQKLAVCVAHADPWKRSAAVDLVRSLLDTVATSAASYGSTGSTSAHSQAAHVTAFSADAQPAAHPSGSQQPASHSVATNVTHQQPRNLEELPRREASLGRGQPPSSTATQHTAVGIVDMSGSSYDQHSTYDGSAQPAAEPGHAAVGSEGAQNRCQRGAAASPTPTPVQTAPKPAKRKFREFKEGPATQSSKSKDGIKLPAYYRHLEDEHQSHAAADDNRSSGQGGDPGHSAQVFGPQNAPARTSNAAGDVPADNRAGLGGHRARGHGSGLGSLVPYDD